MSVIQIKRGLLANLPATGAAGEPIYTTDDQVLHFGTGASVVPLKIAAANVTGLVNGGTEAINAQVGTSYTVVAGDAGKLLTFANASAVAVTVPLSVFTTSQFMHMQNKGTADVTITPTSATINGAANFILHAGQGIKVVYDGANFQVVTGRAVVAKSVVASNFLTGVAADGVFSAAQPAFSDLTGAATAAQLPNPAVAAKGGVFSKAVVASNFLTGISSVDGSVTAAQPAFTDISGTMSAAQLPAAIDGGTF
jgi:hypothetical protein